MPHAPVRAIARGQRRRRSIATATWTVPISGIRPCLLGASKRPLIAAISFLMAPTRYLRSAWPPQGVPQAGKPDACRTGLEDHGVCRAGRQPAHIVAAKARAPRAWRPAAPLGVIRMSRRPGLCRRPSRWCVSSRVAVGGDGHLHAGRQSTRASGYGWRVEKSVAGRSGDRVAAGKRRDVVVRQVGAVVDGRRPLRRRAARPAHARAGCRAHAGRARRRGRLRAPRATDRRRTRPPRRKRRPARVGLHRSSISPQRAPRTRPLGRRIGGTACAPRGHVVVSSAATAQQRRSASSSSRRRMISRWVMPARAASRGGASSSRSSSSLAARVASS